MADFENLTNENEIKEKNSTIKNDLFEWLEILISALMILVIIFTFVFKIVTISGDSMKNTLNSGEKVIISNIGFTPQYGDIVVISRNANNIADMQDANTPIIKRVIATEGQVVDIDFFEGIVYVDGVALDEPYTKTPTNLSEGIEFPVVVDVGCVFVLGDNRNDSTDSRSPNIGDGGMIDTRYILGKALFRVFPFSGFGGLY